jgi:hypothetical protein
MSATLERTRYYSTRPRRVPPEFCSDELLEDCSLLAALLLYRVISQADDQGRLPGHPKWIRAVCFGMRPAISERKVAAALDEIVRAGFLIRYDVAHRVFLQVGHWHDLQGKWGRRAYASRYPAPPGWTDDWVSVKSGDEEPPAADQRAELRAPGAQSAGSLQAPLPVPLPSSLPFSVAGRSTRSAGSSGLERVGALIERAKGARMSDKEAFEMGTALTVQQGTPGSAS